MYQTGRKQFATLQQVFVDTGVPTGVPNKSNDPSDPDYIPPVVDTETCAPSSVPAPLVNKIRLSILNQTSQVVVLYDVLFRGSTVVDLSQAYYDRASLSLMPGDATVSVARTQLDDLSRFIATAHAYSKDIRINLAFEYKTATDSSYTALTNQNLQVNNTIDIATLNTPRIGGDGINDLKITITENPAPVAPPNELPVVNAGIDVTIKLPLNSANLVATATDGDGSVVSTTWSQVSGPSVATISDPASLTSTMGALVEGTYVFKMTAVDNEGGVGFDTVSVIVQPADPNPNGIVNMFVDTAMPVDGLNRINQVTLRKVSTLAVTELLTSFINQEDGVVQRTPLKGVYNIEISVDVNAGPRTIKVQWDTNTVVITANATGVYVVNNVMVDEGAKGVLITYKATVLTPTVSLLYARLTTSSITVDSNPLLPYGLSETGKGNVNVSFFSDVSGTVPAPFTGTVNVDVATTNNISTAITSSLLVKSVSAGNSVLVETSRSFKRWDYTLNDPGAAEVEDLVEDLSYTYTLLPGQGYLIIS